MFLWQMLFRAIATQSLRFPGRIATDPATWCLRCNSGMQEDVTHCIWQCEISQSCWSWGAVVLVRAAELNRHIHFQPEHILVVASLPDSWVVPIRLWKILRATLCWHIWKDRNQKFIMNGGANPDQVIHKAWHRIGTHVRTEWTHLFREIRDGRISILHARDRLAFLFGIEGVVWEIQDVRIPVPPPELAAFEAHSKAPLSTNISFCQGFTRDSRLPGCTRLYG